MLSASPSAVSAMTSRQPRSEVLNTRISEQGKLLLVALQDYYGISQASILEMLIRDRARELEIEVKRPRGRNRGD